MSTSYTAGGLPVGAAPNFPNAESDAAQMGATGANAATTSQESPYDAVYGVPSTGAPAAPRSAGAACGLACVLVLTALGLYAVSKL
jgi:hypothetical protein